jgi:hypothetical protein
VERVVLNALATYAALAAGSNPSAVGDLLPSRSEITIHLFPLDLTSFLFFDPAYSVTFRNIAMLQLGEEISRVHRASPAVLVGSKHFLDKCLEARVTADWIPHWLVFIKGSDRSRCQAAFQP